LINLFSIPYTGTHFLKDLLEQSGLEVRARHIEAWTKTDELVIAPIRDPYDVYVSWVSNKRDQDFAEKWANFNQMFEQQNVFILPIDTHHRNKHLAELGKLLKRPLITDWTPINAKPRHEIGPVDLSEIYALPVVNKFYSQNKLSRKEAEKIVRQIIQDRAGETLAPNLFNDSVEALLEQANG